VFGRLRGALRAPFTLAEVVGVSGIDVVELLARLNEAESHVNVLTARVAELETMVKDLYDARTSPQSSMDVADFLAERVERAVANEPTFARTIYNALAAEIGIDQRTLVTYITRIAASYDTDHSRWGETPTTSVSLARYLAQRTEMPNAYNAKVTRRLHTALEKLGVKSKGAAR